VWQELGALMKSGKTLRVRSSKMMIFLKLLIESETSKTSLAIAHFFGSLMRKNQISMITRKKVGSICVSQKG
jgi:hypothetical protein